MAVRLDAVKLSRVALNQACEVMNCRCTFLFNTQLKPYSGGECAIFAFEACNEAKDRIAIRIEHTPSPSKVQHEVRYLEAIMAAQLPRMPTLLGYSISSTSMPYIALKWIGGNAASWSDVFPNEKGRHNIMKSVAHASIDLLEVRGPDSSALDWITGKIERSRLARAKAGQLHGISVDECQKLMDRVVDFHIPLFDNSPHVLVHGDLQASNIIINETSDVQCIIDWGFASFMPLQFAAVYPRFLTSEPLSYDGGIKWPPDSEAMQCDRRFYLGCVGEIAAVRGGIAQDYYDVLSREDESSRYWWLSAVCQLDIMKALKFRT